MQASMIEILLVQIDVVVAVVNVDAKLAFDLLDVA